MTNKLHFDIIQIMATIQAGFDCSKWENPMGERCKDALRFDFNGKLKPGFHGTEVPGRKISVFVQIFNQAAVFFNCLNGKSKFIVGCLLLLLTGQAILADTILQYSFDGPLGGDVPSGLVDDTGTYTASIIAGSDADSTIKYGEANPFYNPAGTSAEFYNDNWSNDAGDVLIIPDAGENDIAGLDFGPLEQFRVEGYINPTSGVPSTHTRRIYSKSIYCYMYLDSFQTLHAIRKWGGGDWDVKITHLAADNIPLDEWTHIKMTWDAHTTDDKFKLYINGALADSAAGNCLPTADSTAAFAIGGYEREEGTRAQFFCGKLDELKITGSIRDPGRYLTDPHRPVVVEGDPYPTVNILIGENGTVTGQIVRTNENTFGPIHPSFTRQTILELDPLTVTAGVQAKLTPDVNTTAPGRYEYHRRPTTAGEPNYHRTMPFTEDLSFEYKYDILSEKMLNCAVEHVHAMYVRNPSK